MKKIVVDIQMLLTTDHSLSCSFFFFFGMNELQDQIAQNKLQLLTRWKRTKEKATFIRKKSFCTDFLLHFWISTENIINFLSEKIPFIASKLSKRLKIDKIGSGVARLSKHNRKFHLIQLNLQVLKSAKSIMTSKWGFIHGSIVLCHNNWFTGCWFCFCLWTDSHIRTESLQVRGTNYVNFLNGYFLMKQRQNWVIVKIAAGFQRGESSCSLHLAKCEKNNKIHYVVSSPVQFAHRSEINITERKQIKWWLKTSKRQNAV